MRVAPGLARFHQPSIRARPGRGRERSPAQEGIRGWGRHLRGGPWTAAKQHFALTHPTNLRETWILTTAGYSPRSDGPGAHVGRSGDRARMMRSGAGLVHGPIPEERK